MRAERDVLAEVHNPYVVKLYYSFQVCLPSALQQMLQRSSIWVSIPLVLCYAYVTVSLHAHILHQKLFDLQARQLFAPHCDNLPIAVELHMHAAVSLVLFS